MKLNVADLPCVNICKAAEVWMNVVQHAAQH